MWDAACAADSQLLAPATASKLAAEDAGAAAEAAAVLLTQASCWVGVMGWLAGGYAGCAVNSTMVTFVFCTASDLAARCCPPTPLQHARRLGGESSPAAVAAARTVALLLLHPAAAPRAAAATAAASVSATSPELAATLVAGLQHWASHPAAPEVVAVLGDAAGAAQARFASAVVAAAPAEGSVQLSAGLVSALLLLAHHPSVAGAGGGSATWAAVARKLGPVADVLASSPADVAAALVSSPASGAACAEPAQQAAAAGALRAAMALAAAPLFDAVMAALRLLLDSSAHDVLSAREVKIYFTPAGKRGLGCEPRKACVEGCVAGY